MSTALIILIVILVLLTLILLILPLTSFIARSPRTYKIIIGIVKFVIIVMLFLFLMTLFQEMYDRYAGFITSNTEMFVMDGIWYSICLVFLCIMVALIVKLIVEGQIRKHLVFAGISTSMILITYTIIYYMVVFYEYITNVVIVMTIAMVILVALLFIVLRFLNFAVIVNPLYAILSFFSFIYVVCIFIYIFYIIEKSYDYLM